MNWDDLRFVIAVAETGSVSQAAKRLGVNHATVLRRVAVFEERHGTTVFAKTTSGYRVLADKRDVIKAAKAAEAAIAQVGQLAGGYTGDLQGKARITSTDTLCQLVLPAIVADLSAQRNGMPVDLVSANAHIDLARHKIDVAVRPSLALASDLVGEHVATLGLAVYAANPAETRWLGLSGSLTKSPSGRWMAENIDPKRLSATADSFFVLHALAATGCGQAILPCLLGDSDPRLTRIRDEAPHFEVPIWVASHVNEASSARCKSLRAAVSEGLTAQADALSGKD